MSLLTDILKSEGDRVVTDLRESFVKNKINASGRLSDSLEVSVTEFPGYTQMTVSALAYIFTTEEGRGPTEKKGDGELYRRILQWINDKGIKFDDKNLVKKPYKIQDGKRVYIDKSEAAERYKKGIAFAITEKIHNDGTKRFGKKSGVLSNVLNEKRINQITDAITNRIVVDIEESIFRVSKDS